ncbi:flagellar basal body-associated FliL family protein [Methylomonas sp. MgM2]
MAENKPVESEKKSSKKLVLIVVLGVLLLAGAGAAYYFLMYKPAESNHDAERSEQIEQQSEISNAKQEEQGFYYALDAPLMVNFPPGSSARIVKVAVTVLVKDESSVATLKKHEPMIRNNLLMTISSIGADNMKTLEGKQELRATMLTEIGKVMEKMAGANTAKDVFFTEFVMQ